MSTPDYSQPDLALLGPEHVRRYQETDGAVGYLWNGVPTLLLTTTGRRSGQPRTTPLIFARNGEDYLVVASMGGAPGTPCGTRTFSLLPMPTSRSSPSISPSPARTASDGGEARTVDNRVPNSGRTITRIRHEPNGSFRRRSEPEVKRGGAG